MTPDSKTTKISDSSPLFLSGSETTNLDLEADQFRPQHKVTDIVESFLPANDTYCIPESILRLIPGEQAMELAEYTLDEMPKVILDQAGLDQYGKSPAAILSFPECDGFIQPTLYLNLVKRHGITIGKRVMLQVSFDQANYLYDEQRGIVIDAKAVSMPEEGTSPEVYNLFAEASNMTPLIFEDIGGSLQPLEYSPIETTEEERNAEREAQIEAFNEILAPVDLRAIERIYWRAMETAILAKKESSIPLRLKFDPTDLMDQVAQSVGVARSELFEISQTPLLVLPDQSVSELLSLAIEMHSRRLIHMENDTDEERDRRYDLDTMTLISVDNRDVNPTPERAASQILRIGYMVDVAYRAYQNKYPEQPIPEMYKHIVNAYLHYRLTYTVLASQSKDSVIPKPYSNLIFLKANECTRFIDEALSGRTPLEQTRRLSEVLEDLRLEDSLQLLQGVTNIDFSHIRPEEILLVDSSLFDTFLNSNTDDKSVILNKLERKLKYLYKSVLKGPNRFKQANTPISALARLMILTSLYAQESEIEARKLRESELKSLFIRHQVQIQDLLSKLDETEPWTKNAPEWKFGDFDE